MMPEKDSKIDKLLEEYDKTRGIIKTRIERLEDLDRSVQALFPATSDFRNRHLLDEKIKASTMFFDVILKYHQEVNRTVEREIEMRRRLSGDEDGEDEDVRGLIKRLERQGFTVATKTKHEESETNSEEVVDHV